MILRMHFFILIVSLFVFVGGITHISESSVIWRGHICLTDIFLAVNKRIIRCFISDYLEFQVDSEMRLAVQEALSLMADAFKDLNESNTKIMEALLMEAIDKV